MDRKPPGRNTTARSSSKPKAGDQDPPQRRQGHIPSSHTSSQNIDPLAPLANVQQPIPTTGYGLNQSGLDSYTVAQLAALSAAYAPLQTSHPATNPYMNAPETLAAIRHLQSVGLLNPLTPVNAINVDALLSLHQGIFPNQTGLAPVRDARSADQISLASSHGLPWLLGQSQSHDALASNPYALDSFLRNAHQLYSLSDPSSSLSTPPSYRDTNVPGYGTQGPQPVQPSAQAEQLIDDATITEDKRRRNTLASARFRIKKKHRTLMLERSIDELESRSGDLEREATELRRENGWLKEILIMKGRSVQGGAAGPSGSSLMSHSRPGPEDVDDADDSSDDSSDQDGDDERVCGVGGGTNDSPSSNSKNKGKGRET